MKKRVISDPRAILLDTMQEHAEHIKTTVKNDHNGDPALCCDSILRDINALREILREQTAERTTVSNEFFEEALNLNFVNSEGRGNFLNDIFYDHMVDYYRNSFYPGDYTASEIIDNYIANSNIVKLDTLKTSPQDTTEELVKRHRILAIETEDDTEYAVLSYGLPSHE